MVNGCQTVTGTSHHLTVVDLDGTLVRGNTLHIYIMCAVGQALKEYKVGLAGQILSLLVLRRMHVITHARMKFNILRLSKHLTGIYAKFSHIVHKKFRTDVTTLLEQRRSNGDTILLATAAADIYIPYIWDGEYVATPLDNNPNMEECRGQNKKALVERYAASHSLTISTVITDHADDLPLLTIPSIERILVSPSPSLRTAVSMANLQIDQILE